MPHPKLPFRSADPPTHNTFWQRAAQQQRDQSGPPVKKYPWSTPRDPWTHQPRLTPTQYARRQTLRHPLVRIAIGFGIVLLALVIPNAIRYAHLYFVYHPHASMWDMLVSHWVPPGPLIP